MSNAFANDEIGVWGTDQLGVAHFVEWDDLNYRGMEELPTAFTTIITNQQSYTLFK
ncbi:MAG: hypothetical protein AAFR31_03690 [Cyanobacteria bacterium J06627_8]